MTTKKPTPKAPAQDKVPPHDKDLEEAVLGAIILDSKSLIELLPALKDEVFYDSQNNLVCTAILGLIVKEAPVDMLTVMEELKRQKTIEEAGGFATISKLTDRISTTQNASYHYRILLEYYFRRKMIHLSYETIELSHDMSQDVFETYDWHMQEMEQIEIHMGAGSYIDSKRLYTQLIDQMNSETKRPTFFPIADTGIDSILTLSPGNLINMSGKSGAGKTSFVAHLARRLLETYNDVAILWYTMEDEASKIMYNFVSPYLHLTNSQLTEKGYKLSIQEKEQFVKLSKKFGLYDIEFSEKPSFIAHIKAHFQRFCAQRPKKFNILIVDNVMLLKDNHQYRFKGKSFEVDDHIASQLQSTFTSTKNDYDVNIWYLHHLTKEQLSKTNFTEGYRPREDNIRGSTRLRDVCTQGILLNRPGEFPDIVRYYKDGPLEDPIRNLMVAEVFKNRNGKTGFFRYFSNLDYKIFYPF